ncbi:DUF222 domain-containing protein [Microbacterium sp. 179-B 1A2 NHS]|uniref:HNH endonuclease signature motif containing protein n=1 Tax=Microbacterium sp. 179-B 1A2 NHS TaxID=3142383 RepID=UPI0039A33C0A
MGHETVGDPSADDGHELGWRELDALVGHVVTTRREIARLQAAEARLLAGAVGLVGERAVAYRERTGTFGSDLPLREVSLELGAAMRVSDRTVQGRLGDATILVELFSQTLAAWESGTIDAGHAWAIVRAGTLITEESSRGRYEVLALAAAETESPGRMASVARAIAAAVDPDAFSERLAQTGAERAVKLYDLDDGMARLIADLPAPLAYAIRERLMRLGEEAVRDDDSDRSGVPAFETCEREDPADHATLSTCGTRRGSAIAAPQSPRRTADQVRADVFADLLLTGVPTAHGDPAVTRTITGRIQVTVPASTLAGMPGAPAILAGYGPVDPGFARRFAGAAPGWDRVFTDPYTGEPLATDRYRPSAQLRRFLAARDERCRTPGCTRPAHRSDIDHNRPAADGGPTQGENLAHFCRRHHTGKHHTAWRVRQLGHGVLEWAGPTGRRYLDRPPAVVRFVPDIESEPPPF